MILVYVIVKPTCFTAGLVVCHYRYVLSDGTMFSMDVAHQHWTKRYCYILSIIILQKAKESTKKGNGGEQTGPSPLLFKL
jgi:hypothetical protein